MSDTEKVSFNMSVVELGKVDLLVEQGFYSSRTDFIRSAARDLLNTHDVEVKRIATSMMMVMGILAYDEAQLQKLVRSRKQLDIRIVGLVVFAADVLPETVSNAIKSIKVFGVVRASPEVKAELGLS